MLSTINRVKDIAKKRPKPVVKKVTKRPDIDFDIYVRMVEKKAYELYEQRGCRHGSDLEDWFKAEDLVENELCR